MTYRQIKNISYYDKSITANSELQTENAYRAERCKLDLYYPEGRQDFPTLIWFHGGGITEGEKYLPQGLLERNLAVVTPNYRLSGNRAQCPDYIEDAAAATAWTLKNISTYGGDPKKVFISGSSAGGYLSAMVGMDGTWLKKLGCCHRDLAGIISMTGQMTTHFQINCERNLSQTPIVIDALAPMSHISRDLPPILLLVGDRDLDIPARTEENLLLAAILRRIAGHPATEIVELQGYDHSNACEAFDPVLKFIQKFSDA